MLPRVLFAESHKYFRSNMDRNYANKHNAVCAHFPREILTPADVSESPQQTSILASTTSF